LSGEEVALTGARGDVLAVVLGDRRVDLAALKELFGSTYVSFASRRVAERLTDSTSGTVLPFSFEEELELITDLALLEKEEIFFNAARTSTARWP